MPDAPFLTPDALLAHWQGHRRLTRRVIEAFPEDALFTHSIGGMRPFGAMALEFLSMAAPMVKGVATNVWTNFEEPKAKTRAEVLRLWDEQTAEMDRLWPTIPAARFQETMTAFGQFTGPVHWLIMYCVDNEIHHRGQGFVYLRSLGIEPPHFWERE